MLCIKNQVATRNYPPVPENLTDVVVLIKVLKMLDIRCEFPRNGISEEVKSGNFKF